MRLELFGKNAQSLRAEARTLVSYGALGLNVPHKSKDSPPLATLLALQDVLPPKVLRECVPHYSLKFAYDRSPDSFLTFCAAAAALPTPPRQLLLVSGSGQRKFDTVQCLKSLPQEHSDAIGIGVAFNPYIPDRAQRERERARLRLKVGTGRVSAIWLQVLTRVRGRGRVGGRGRDRVGLELGLGLGLGLGLRVKDEGVPNPNQVSTTGLHTDPDL